MLYDCGQLCALSQTVARAVMFRSANVIHSSKESPSNVPVCTQCDACIGLTWHALCWTQCTRGCRVVERPGLFHRHRVNHTAVQLPHNLWMKIPADLLQKRPGSEGLTRSTCGFQRTRRSLPTTRRCTWMVRRWHAAQRSPTTANTAQAGSITQRSVLAL